MKTVLALLIASLVFVPFALLGQGEPTDRSPFGEGFAVEGCPPEAAGALAEITCGFLAIPENRANPASRTLKVAVANANTPKPDPETPLAALGADRMGYTSIEAAAEVDLALEIDQWNLLGGSSGQSSPLTTELQAQIDEEIAANPEIPGQLLTVIAPTAGVDADFAAGVVDVESGDALEPGAAFRIASVTKTFTAAAVLRLVEMGRVDLDASIEGYVSAESIAALQADGYATDRITVLHLLTHTSGIADFASRNQAYVLSLLDDPTREWTRIDQIQFAVDTADPIGEPGAQYSYSDTGYSLLGELIEAVTGQPIAAAVRDLLAYDRLGLSATYWEVFEPAPAGTIMAHQYLGDLDLTATLSPTADLYGAGGIVSTTRDLAVFFRALLRGEVFDQPGTLDIMLTVPDVSIGADGGFMDAALGIYRLRGDGLTCWSHSGSWGVLAIYCPDLDVAVARSIQQMNQQDVALLSVVNPVLIHILDSAS